MPKRLAASKRELRHGREEADSSRNTFCCTACWRSYHATCFCPQTRFPDTPPAQLAVYAARKQAEARAAEWAAAYRLEKARTAACSP